MKVEIETEDRHECTLCEYKYTTNKNLKIHTLGSNKSLSEEGKDSKFQCDECEYKCCKKDTQKPYRRD